MTNLIEEFAESITNRCAKSAKEVGCEGNKGFDLGYQTSAYINILQELNLTPEQQDIIRFHINYNTEPSDQLEDEGEWDGDDNWTEEE